MESLDSLVVLVRFILNRGKLDGAKLRVGVRNLKLKIKKIKCKIDKRNFPKYKGEFTLDCSTREVGSASIFSMNPRPCSVWRSSSAWWTTSRSWRSSTRI